MSKLGDKLRELAALVDRDNLAGVGFIQVGEHGWQLTCAKSSDSERDAKALATSLYQATRAYTAKGSAPASNAAPIRTVGIAQWRDRFRPRFAEMCALKNWRIPITDLRLNMMADAILIGDVTLVTRVELDDNIPTSEIYARMEKICAERMEQAS